MLCAGMRHLLSRPVGHNPTRRTPPRHQRLRTSAIGTPTLANELAVAPLDSRKRAGFSKPPPSAMIPKPITIASTQTPNAHALNTKYLSHCAPPPDINTLGIITAS